MNIAFFMIVPILFWLFVLMLVIAVAKPKRRPTQTGRNQTYTQSYSTGASGSVTPRQSTKPAFNRPEMREGLFEMKLGKSEEKKKTSTFFSNTGYDDYSVLNRKKDYVSGYDKKYSKESIWSRQSSAKQYSHTYNGHEPWDKCLPKEKDPWDKDFYV